MPQIEINSLFTNGGLPATDIGVTTPGYPSVRIWEIDGVTQSLIVGSPVGIGQNTDGIMIEVTTSGSPAIKDGFYTFLFTDLIGYDPIKKYSIRIDGGPSLATQDRYQSSHIDPIEETIINGIWDEPMAPDHLIAGTAGEIISQTNANTTQLFLDVSAVDAIVSLLLKYDTNRTILDEVAKTLTVYDDDCTTILRVFALFDENGVPSTDPVCERKPITTGPGDNNPVCP